MHNNTKYQCTNDRKNDKVISMRNVRYKSRKPSMLYTSSIAYHNAYFSKCQHEQQSHATYKLSTEWHHWKQDWNEFSLACQLHSQIHLNWKEQCAKFSDIQEAQPISFSCPGAFNNGGLRDRSPMISVMGGWFFIQEKPIWPLQLLENRWTAETLPWLTLEAYSTYETPSWWEG